MAAPDSGPAAAHRRQRKRSILYGPSCGRAKTRLRKAYVAASWFVVDQNIDQGRAKA
jgi:hypothetical protein